MTMDRPAVFGVAFGVAIGVVYIALQRWDMRQKSSAAQPRGMIALIPGAVGRLMFVVVALGLVFRFTDADKYWLTGSLFVSYGVLFLWQLKRMFFSKK